MQVCIQTHYIKTDLFNNHNNLYPQSSNYFTPEDFKGILMVRVGGGIKVDFCLILYFKLLAGGML